MQEGIPSPEAEAIVMADYEISPHALQAADRGISLQIIDDVIRNPQQMVPGNELGTLVCQSRLFFGAKEFLVRVVVGTDLDPVVVSTWNIIAY